MKSLLITLLIAYTSLGIQAQNSLETTFKKYKNETYATSLTFDERVMNYLKTDGKEWKTHIDKVTMGQHGRLG